MNIIKSMHSGLIHKTYTFQRKHTFVASTLWGFKLSTAEPVLEMNLWTLIGKVMGKSGVFDMGMPKAQGEVLCEGSFFSPGGREVLKGTVSIAIGDVSKELAVFGERRWSKAFGLGVGIAGPEPFTTMAIAYTGAFGGEGYAKNPTGRGLTPEEDEDGPFIPLPNIEYPDQLIVLPGDRPEPAGFSRLDLLWEPRSLLAGTYDKKYIKEDMPGLPEDIDWSFFNDAPQDQWIAGFFRGMEAFEITNMSPEHATVQGKLPGVYGRAFINQDEDGQIVFREIPTRLDTVWFFPAEDLGIVIHRGTIPVSQDDGTDVKQILIAHENLADPPRNLEHYQGELTKRIDPQEGFKYMLNTGPLIPEGCRCGFEIIKTEGNFPLEMLGKRNMEAYSKNKEREVMGMVASQMDEAKRQMEGSSLGETGVNLDQVLDAFDKAKTAEPSPEAIRINELLENIAPGMVKDPANLDITRLNLKGIDDLTAYLKELQEEKRRMAENTLHQELGRLRSMELDNPTVSQSIGQIEAQMVAMKQPPVLPRINVEELIRMAKEQFDGAMKQAMVMGSMGLPMDQLKKLPFDLPAMEKQIIESMEKAKDGYRIGAHYVDEATSPHKGREPEMAAALLQAHKQGRETAGGDYAYLDLSGQDLSGIDLSGSYLEHANLTDANLSGANLSRAILAHANLTGANFSGAKLNEANLGATIIEGTLFADADLTGAILGRARIKKARFHRCQLVGRQEMFLEAKVEQVDFTGSNLKKSIFLDADLSGCCFRGADLSESNFINPIAHGAIFDNAMLQGVNFIKIQAEKASFQGAQAKNMRFVGGCNLAGANFKGAQAPEANLRDCNLQNADFTEAMLHKADLGGSDLTGARLTRADAVQAQLNKAILLGADLERINLMEGSLYKARLAGASLVEANLYAVNFLGCITGEPDLDEADFTDAYLERVNLREQEAED